MRAVTWTAKKNLLEEERAVLPALKPPLAIRLLDILLVKRDIRVERSDDALLDFDRKLCPRRRVLRRNGLGDLYAANVVETGVSTGSTTRPRVAAPVALASVEVCSNLVDDGSLALVELGACYPAVCYVNDEPFLLVLCDNRVDPVANLGADRSSIDLVVLLALPR